MSINILKILYYVQNIILYVLFQPIVHPKTLFPKNPSTGNIFVRLFEIMQYVGINPKFSEVSLRNIF